MKSGSTGWSTGPHLHFEIRVNGVAVDSLPYITGMKYTEEENENDESSNTINNKVNAVLENNT